MAQNQTITEIQVLDANFNEISSKEGKKIYVESKKTYTTAYGKKNEIKAIYTIHKDGKKVEFDKNYFKKLEKESQLDAEKIFEFAVKQDPTSDKIDLTPKKWNTYLTFGIVASILLLIAVIVSLTLTIPGKNFNSETVSSLTEENLALGDFVEEFDAEAWGFFEVEITETSTTYGIETGSSTEVGNTYLLLTKPLNEIGFEETPETFIYRFPPSENELRDRVNELDENALEWDFTGLSGEVTTLNNIERMDSGQQIDEFFTEQQELQGLGSTQYFIDGTVTQGDLNEVILINSSVGVVFLIAIGLTVFFYIKRQNHVKDQVMEIAGKVSKSGPVEKSA